MDYEFSTHILPASTDDAQVLQIFARLNSSGAKLEPQELRNAEFSGPLKTVAYSLASEQLERWRAWKIFSETQIARMHKVELTSEFLLLFVRGITRRASLRSIRSTKRMMTSTTPQMKRSADSRQRWMFARSFDNAMLFDSLPL